VGVVEDGGQHLTAWLRLKACSIGVSSTLERQELANSMREASQRIFDRVGVGVQGGATVANEVLAVHFRQAME